MFNVRLDGDHLYGKWLSAWLSLVISLIVYYFVLSVFPRDVLGEIWDSIESVPDNFPSYSESHSLHIRKNLNITSGNLHIKLLGK